MTPVFFIVFLISFYPSRVTSGAIIESTENGPMMRATDPYAAGSQVNLNNCKNDKCLTVNFKSQPVLVEPCPIGELGQWKMQRATNFNYSGFFQLVNVKSAQCLTVGNDLSAFTFDRNVAFTMENCASYSPFQIYSAKDMWRNWIGTPYYSFYDMGTSYCVYGQDGGDGLIRNYDCKQDDKEQWFFYYSSA